MLDTWEAVLSNGRLIIERHAALWGMTRSPWRQLERYCRDTGWKIVETTIILGLWRIAMSAEDGVLVIGEHHDIETDIASGHTRTKRYRWVCRQGPSTWLWRLTDGIQPWEIETTPGIAGRERMPLPPKDDNDE